MCSTWVLGPHAQAVHLLAAGLVVEPLVFQRVLGEQRGHIFQILALPGGRWYV